MPQYRITDCYGADHTLGYKSIDPSVVKPLKMNEVYSLYRKLYLTLEADVLVGKAYVDLDSIRTEYLNSQETVEDVFKNWGTASLPTIDKIRRRKVAKVNYQDAFMAGYKVAAVNADSREDVYSTEELRDLKFYRDSTDMNLFYKSAIVTVNGLCHRLDTDGTNCYAIGAAKVATHYKYSSVGILDFEHIGKIKTIPIVKDMILPIEPDSKRVYIKLKPKELDGKVFIVSIAGYLTFYETNKVSVFNSDTICLDLFKLRILDQYLESFDILGLSHLGLPDPRQFHFSINDFYSAENLVKYLTLDQSFIIVLDTDNLHIQKEIIKHNTYPGVYTTYTKPSSPMQTSTGRLPEYYTLYEDGHYMLTVNDAFYRYQHHESVPEYLNKAATSQQHPYRTYYDSKGAFLHMLSESIVA